MEPSPDYLESISRKLTAHLPASIQAYNSVMLALSDDGIERGEAGRVIVSMFSASDGDDDLRNLLEENINWSEEIEFAGLNERYLGLVESLAPDDTRVSSKWIYETPASHLYHTSHLMTIPESLAKARLPSSGSFKFQAINRHFSSLLCSSWKFSVDTTVEIISTLANLGRVLGIFCQGETKPIAWMVIWSDGVAGMLRTREDFRNKGVASFLLKKTAEKMLDLGLVPCVHIEDDNLVSQRLFNKNGFVSSELAQWVIHKPAGTNLKK